MSSNSDSAKASAIAEARREALAARAIISDPNCLPRQATSHIVAGWRALRGPRDARAGDLAQWVREQLSSRDGEQVAATVRLIETSGDREAIEHLSEGDVHALVQTLLAQVRAGALEEGVDSKRCLVSWGRRIGVWVVVSVVLAMGALRPWTYSGIGQWHAAYYPGKDFRGKPDVGREANVDFSWGLEPPTDSIPADRFAARWTTCLRTENDGEVAFLLLADDAAKLIIDGEDIIDLWDPEPGTPMPQSLGQKTMLEAGTHAIVVEYREERAGAMVRLLASLDPELPPGPLPSSMLDYPGEDFDEDDPCGSL